MAPFGSWRCLAFGAVRQLAPFCAGQGAGVSRLAAIERPSLRSFDVRHSRSSAYCAACTDPWHGSGTRSANAFGSDSRSPKKYSGLRYSEISLYLQRGRKSALCACATVGDWFLQARWDRGRVQRSNDTCCAQSLPGVHLARRASRVARRKLEQIDSIDELHLLAIPPGNHLEALRGDRTGQRSIRINDKYRVVFTWSILGAEGRGARRLPLIAGVQDTTHNTRRTRSRGAIMVRIPNARSANPPRRDDP